MTQRYDVFLDRNYAADKSKLKICEPLASTTVTASSRSEAAKVAWFVNEYTWRKLVTVPTKRISLHAGPVGSVTESASRMPPIEVWRKV